jgi:archaeoflavoprotein AfpA
MATEKVKGKKRKVAWGITGGGDKIAETVEVMKGIKKEYENTVEIQVFLSKAAETVLRFYDLESELKQNFAKVTLEINPNSPFLAAWMQMRKYEFLLIAPATSNTVAKIVNGIGDSLLSNAAIMSLKALIPLYATVTDYREKLIYTILPNGEEIKLRIRKEDAENTIKLERMEGVVVLESPQRIPEIFKKWFAQS